MTLEQALLAALTAVSGVLITVSKLLWNEAMECKEDRKTIRSELDELREDHGLNAGRLEAVDRCPIAACPHRRAVKAAGKAAAAAAALLAICMLPGCAAAPSGISVGWEGDIGGVPVRASYRPGGKATVMIDGGRWMERRVKPSK
jgi:hypothetical protein